MAAQALPQHLAAQIKYTPQTGQSFRKSQRLADALAAMQQDGSKGIQTGTELGAKLLATLILDRAGKRADKDALTSYRTDQDAETSRLLAGFGGLGQPTPPPGQTPPGPVSQPVQPPQAQQAPAPVAQQVPQQAQPAPQPMAAKLDPQIDAIVRTVAGEAGGEDPTGQAAVAAVILNRSKKSGRTPMEIVFEPHQFEPWSNGKARRQMEALTPDSPQYQAILRNIAPALQGQDPTNGADHFYSPRTQEALGRPPPKWDNGKGIDHGNHRFFALGYGGQGNHARDAQPPQMPPMAAPSPQPMPQGPAQPFQVAANGPMTPGMMPQGQQGPQGGAPQQPPPMPPQQQLASQQPSQAPQWPTWQPTPQQIEYVKAALADPRRHDEGVQLAQQLQYKMTQPAEGEVIQIGGLPFYVSKTPGQGGQPVRIPIPPEAMTQHQSAAQAGVQAPTGTQYDVDPLGNRKEVFRPAQGQQVASGPNGAYRETPIQGGANDPTSPANLVSNERQLRSEYDAQLKPYIEARNGYEKVLTAATDNTGASDIALIFGFMKTLDPSSTVREGEFATAQNSGSIDQSVMNLYNKAIKGERLQPEQRQQFAQTAAGQFAVAQQRFDQTNQRFGQIAQSYGFDPGRVIQQFPAPQAATRPPAPEPDVVDRSGRGAGWTRQVPQAQVQTALKYKGSTAPGGSQQNPLMVQSKQQYEALKPGQWFIDDDGTVVQKAPR